MKRNLILILMSILALSARAQSYDDMWKAVTEAERKDLPKTQVEELDKIVSKAKEEKAYGQLLSAELMRMAVRKSISPDSIGNDMEHMKAAATAAEGSDPVLSAVYAAVIGKVMLQVNAPNLEWNDDDGKAWQQKALAHPELLAQHRTSEYLPLLNEKKGSKLFDNDLLHVMALTVDNPEMLYNHYRNNGNRTAACMAAALMVSKGKLKGSRTERTAWIDSRIADYGDLPVACELAMARLSLMDGKVSQQEEIKYIDNTLQRWSSWQHTNKLKSRRAELVNPQFSVEQEDRRPLPYRPLTLRLNDVRNIKQLDVKVSRTKLDGDTKLHANSVDDYKEIKKNITAADLHVVSRNYADRKDYETFNDSIVLPPMAAGVYLVDFYNDGERIKGQSRILYVSSLFVIAEKLSENKVRYAVVDAATGQPVKGAHLRLSNASRYYKGKKETTLTTNNKGEAVYEYADKEERLSTVYPFTADDKACEEDEIWTSFSYYESSKGANKVRLYTDRSIYRPGQTVSCSVIAFHRDTDGLTMSALADKNTEFTLYDANDQAIASQTVKTDSYGVAATEFTLPTNMLTGAFTVKARIGGASESNTIHVEEYKRPTFEVEFNRYEGAYQRGDTITVTGKAKSYAGVPVQGATVAYTIKRRQSWWCWWFRYHNDEEELDRGEAVTNDNGEFSVRVPMVLPPEIDDVSDRRGLFYDIMVDATVTDQGGESHGAQTALPIGTKSLSLSCSVPQRILSDDDVKISFSLRNASGNETDGNVTYRIDGGKAMKTKANSSITVTPKLSSGRHKVTAECQGETAEAEFVVFSLNDKRPAANTHDWFYVSDTQFPRNGKPVYVQIGSSDPDQHILYTILSGNNIVEEGAIDQSNALTTRTFTYKEEYGDGLKMVFAWVKDGIFYNHETQIARPQPDKQLKLSWTTFRDKLEPGQKEEWTLHVKNPDGTPADAQLMCAMYDKSLDQLYNHSWSFSLPFVNHIPSTSFRGIDYSRLRARYYANMPYFGNDALEFTEFNRNYFNAFFNYYGMVKVRGAGRGMRNKAAVLYEMAVADEAPLLADAKMEMRAAPVMLQKSTDEESSTDDADSGKSEDIQLRENLNETAFFYPQLTTDGQGNFNIRFTLPESLTTWKFMGIAHDKTMNNGYIGAEVVGQKTVMVQPNMPRFVREGDEAQIATRIINTSENTISGTARLELIDPATEQTVMTTEKSFTLNANTTTNTVFDLPVNDTIAAHPLLIARIIAQGGGYSDGEQHYLPILPNKEMVTNTLPFTQNAAGTFAASLSRIFPEGVTQKKLTVEYTNNPAWMMIQALPYVGNADEKNTISLLTAYYANSIADNIMHSAPNIKHTIEQWQQEKGEETSLMSSLEKNQTLKELVLNETPWVGDARNESQQKQSLARYFDENRISQQLDKTLAEMKALQKGDGSWCWWDGMRGSPYITMAVCKTLVRLNKMIGVQEATVKMIDKGMKFMDKEIDDEVRELKKLQKKGYEVRPSELACDYLYTCALSQRQLSKSAKANSAYLVKLLSQKTTEFTMYGKAHSAFILARNGYTKKAQEYLKSLKEYTVCTEEMGRYFDTQKAYYSWRDYRIPTQTAAIEVLKELTPDDRQTIQEMQRWLLQEKRTQAWDTPVNSVDAIYAFSEQGQISQLAQNGENATLTLDSTPIDLPQATAGMGYVKTTIDNPDASTFEARKTSDNTSWGALYAQFLQPVTEIEDASAGLTVRRELLKDGKPADKLKVGDRVTVRLIIRAERDYDFVQLTDKRAACMEPVNQLSGYHWGYYIAPKDYTTNYYFDILSKGTHVVEADYYIDRAGNYQTGTCTVQCAYAPEYSGRKKGEKLNVENK